MVSYTHKDSILSPDLLVKVVGSSAIEAGLISGSLHVRQKSDVGQWAGNCKYLLFKIDESFLWHVVLIQFQNELNCQFSLFWRFGKSHAVVTTYKSIRLCQG